MGGRASLSENGGSMSDPPLPPNAALRWDRVSRLLPHDAHDVLEIGCGQGGFAVRLARRYRYVGVDVDSSSVDATRRRLAAAGLAGDALLGDPAEVLPASATFDLVCAFEVLEHLEDDQGALRQWSERLRPGGMLLISVPAWQRRYTIWDELAGHFRRYDVDVLEDRLAAAGLEPRTIAYGWPLSYLLEAVRDAVARRRGVASAGSSFQARTEASGRLFNQPRGGLRSAAVQAGLLPFMLLQRCTTKHGANLLGIGLKPS
jgi:SAM-dependent methyltransferase